MITPDPTAHPTECDIFTGSDDELGLELMLTVWRKDGALTLATRDIARGHERWGIPVPLTLHQTVHADATWTTVPR
jgi:hypothetical protein